jgi:hypothetical protein
MPLHIERNLEKLSVQTARCGPSAGKALVVFSQYRGDSSIAVWLLKDWVMEHFLQQWTFKAMTENALKANARISAGRYLVLEPLRIGDIDAEMSDTMIAGRTREDERILKSVLETRNADKYTPNGCSFVDIDYHDRKLANIDPSTGARVTCTLIPEICDEDSLQRDASREPWAVTDDKLVRPAPGQDTCYCFRSFNKFRRLANGDREPAHCTMHGTLEYDVPPDTLSHRVFTKRHHPDVARSLRVVRGSDSEPDDDDRPVHEVATVVPHPRGFGHVDRSMGALDQLYPDDFLISIKKRNAGARVGKGDWDADDKAHIRAYIALDAIRKGQQKAARAAAAPGGAGEAGPT